MGSRLAVIATTVVLVGATAGANPLELTGLTSRHAGEAGAGIASVDDAAAVFYDPAGLATAPRMELSFGWVGAHAHLSGGARRLVDPTGFQLALRAPLPLQGDLGRRIVVGMALHLLPKDVTRVVAPAPDQPYYPYEDRLARIAVVPGIGVRLDHGLQLGLGVNVLAGLTGSLSAADGVARGIDSRVDERVQTIARIIAGAQWQVADAWRVGAVFRQKFAVPFATKATTIVGGEPIDLDLSANGLFTPHEAIVGVAYQHRRATVALDLQWAKWSDYDGPYVHVDSVLPLAGPVPGQSPHLTYSDTIAARIGFETTRPRTECGWIARAGYAFETSPIPASQPGVSNLLDGPHHHLAIGGGWQWPRALAGHGLRLDAHLALELVQHRTITKELFGGTGTYDPDASLRDEDPDTSGLQISNPGYPSLRSGGQVFSGGLTLEVGL